VYGSLSVSAVWKKAKATSQPFLYYTGKDKDGHHYFSNNPYKNELRGDFFLPSDVTPYKGEVIEEPKPSKEELLESIKKRFPVGSVVRTIHVDGSPADIILIEKEDIFIDGGALKSFDIYGKSGFLTVNGFFAEIINNTPDAYDFLIEQAKKRFPVGCEVYLVNDEGRYDKTTILREETDKIMAYPEIYDNTIGIKFKGGRFLFTNGYWAVKSDVTESPQEPNPYKGVSIVDSIRPAVKAYEAIREATVPETIIAPAPKQIPKLFNPNEEDYKRKDVSIIKPVNSLKTKLLSFED